MSSTLNEEVEAVVTRVKAALGDRISDLDEDNVQCYARMVVTEGKLYSDMIAVYEQHGSYITTGENGSTYLDPSVTAFRAISKERLAIGEKLGLSPKSRGENLREERQGQIDELATKLPGRR